MTRAAAHRPRPARAAKPRVRLLARPDRRVDAPPRPLFPDWAAI